MDEYLKKILLDNHYVEAAQMKDAESYAASHNTSFLEYLFNEELLSRELVGQAMAESYGMPYVNVTAHMPKESVIVKIPQTLAQKNRVALFEETDKGIVIVSDQKMTAVSSEIGGLFSGKRVVVAYATPEELAEMWKAYHAKLNVRFAEIVKAEKRVAPEIIDQIISDAVTLRASDIHFEPNEAEVRVRFRIDGVLEEGAMIPKVYYENILNRLKIEAHLRIDTHNKSQDGAIRFHKEGMQVDLRISIIPTLDGEKVVIRILSEYLKNFSLADLGLTQEYQGRITEMANRPYGMILAVGPTGSGKSTTLYAILKLLNDRAVNITTIEDPVEYRLQGVNQIQVNRETELTFANGLRSIVRQDPDIILVGEIRDLETAEISVNASLTGHLLLSTFHANDAATVVPRLLDMGVEPFLLSSTLMVIMAERLTRRICPSCKETDETTVAEIEKRFPQVKGHIPKDLTMYKGKGCSACNYSGYKGRIGIFEFIEVSPALQELILQNPSARQIRELAAKENGRTLFDDGIEKVKTGLTTLEELLRVAMPTVY